MVSVCRTTMSDDGGGCGGDSGGGGGDSCGGGDVSGSGGCDSTSYHHDSGHHAVSGPGGCDSTSYHHDSGHHGTDHCHSSAKDNDQNLFKDYSSVGAGIDAPGWHNDYDADDSYSSTKTKKVMKKVKRKDEDMHQQYCCVLI